MPLFSASYGTETTVEAHLCEKDGQWQHGREDTSPPPSWQELEWQWALPSIVTYTEACEKSGPMPQACPAGGVQSKLGHVTVEAAHTFEQSTQYPEPSGEGESHSIAGCHGFHRPPSFEGPADSVRSASSEANARGPPPAERGFGPRRRLRPRALSKPSQARPATPARLGAGWIARRAGSGSSRRLGSGPGSGGSRQEWAVDE